MRILLLTHFLGGNHLGGTEVLTLAMAHGLQAQGHEVQVVCAEDWDTATSHKIESSTEVFQGVPIHRLHFNWKKAPDVFRYLYDNPEVETYISTYLTQFKPDIVHITSCYALSASIITVAHEHKIPCVLTATDFWFLCARNTLLQRDDSLCTGPDDAWKCAKCNLHDAKIYRWPRLILPEQIIAPILLQAGKSPFLTSQRGVRGMHGNWEKRFTFLAEALQKVDYIATASQFLRSLFVQYGTPQEKIHYSAYGLDTRWATQYKNKTPAEALRIGFIGQILPMKGPDLLIKAFQQMKSSRPLQLIIYGDLSKWPDYGQSLQELATGDERIRFAGTFKNNKMGEVLSEIDVLVVPSTWYDFPLVIPSALATNTPVVTTNIPGMNELIQSEVNGLLFERYDWQGLAQQLQRLANEASLLSRLQQGCGPVKTVDEMVAEYELVYQALLKKKEESRRSTWTNLSSGLAKVLFSLIPLLISGEMPLPI